MKLTKTEFGIAVLAILLPWVAVWLGTATADQATDITKFIATTYIVGRSGVHITSAIKNGGVSNAPK